jgi:hypothetical protein
MPFREKSAWISAITLVFAYMAYVATLANGLVQGRGSGLWFLHPLVLFVITLTVLQVALHVLVAARAPDDARAPRDERESAIAWRGTTIGYYVLICAVVTSMAAIYLGFSAFYLINGMFSALVLAETVKWGAQIVMFRRGG